MKYAHKYLFSILPIIALSACHTVRVAPPAPKVQTKAISASHEAKDTVVVEEAAKIDAIAPQAKVHTDAQRAAVAAAPAVELKPAFAILEKQIVEQDKTIVEVRRELVEAKNATDRIIRLGGYGLAALLVAAGVASFFLASYLPMLGPRAGIAIIAAGGSIFAMVQAYEFTKAHPWITGISGAFLLAAAVLIYANHAHSKSDK